MLITGALQWRRQRAKSQRCRFGPQTHLLARRDVVKDQQQVHATASYLAQCACERVLVRSAMVVNPGWMYVTLFRSGWSGFTAKSTARYILLQGMYCTSVSDGFSHTMLLDSASQTSCADTIITLRHINVVWHASSTCIRCSHVDITHTASQHVLRGARSCQ
jgi:hypothetical protein